MQDRRTVGTEASGPEGLLIILLQLFVTLTRDNGYQAAAMELSGLIDCKTLSLWMAPMKANTHSVFLIGKLPPLWSWQRHDSSLTQTESQLQTIAFKGEPFFKWWWWRKLLREKSQATTTHLHKWIENFVLHFIWKAKTLHRALILSSSEQRRTPKIDTEQPQRQFMYKSHSWYWNVRGAHGLC